MNIIQIKIEGIATAKYSAIAHENLGYCDITKKAVDYIKAQSVDGQIYSGMETCTNIFCHKNGNIFRYYIKGVVRDEKDPFAPSNNNEWKWRWVEIRVVEVME